VGLLNPAGHRAGVDPDTFAGIDAALAVQRCVVAELGTITCASSDGPASPCAIGRLGAQAWKMASHFVHASLGLTVRMTLKRAGTYSRCSETSAPMLRSRPPQAVQPQA
jgi:hypothetical protein